MESPINSILRGLVAKVIGKGETGVPSTTNPLNVTALPTKASVRLIIETV